MNLENHGGRIVKYLTVSDGLDNIQRALMISHNFEIGSIQIGNRDLDAREWDMEYFSEALALDESGPDAWLLKGLALARNGRDGGKDG